MAISVLVVGETQQGKSTLIARIAEYAKANTPEIAVGDGNTSCTHIVGMYPVAATVQTYCLRDHEGRVIKKPFSEMLDLDPHDVVLATEEESNPARVEYLLIDTPGLDDSSGSDMDIMAGIMGRISELSHLNAIIYVRGIGKPLGNTFQTFFKYLQESMPSLCNGLIIVHTMFTVDIQERALDCGEKLAEQRRKDFRHATKIDLQHIFMDNVPNEDLPFANMLSLNQCSGLLRLLATQRPLPVSGFNLLKTPRMMNFDLRVVVQLQDLKSKLTERWSKALDKAAESTRNTMMFARKAQKTKRELQTLNEELASLNTNDQINLGQRAVSKDFGFIKNVLLKGEFYLDDEKVEFDSDCTITDVDKSTSGKSEWREEQLRGGHWSAKLFAPAFRSINGSATFYTTNRVKHEKEIAILKRTIQSREQALADEEEMLQALKASSGRPGDASAEDLVAKIEACSALVAKIQQRNLDLTLWPMVKRFYADDTSLNNSGHFREFIRVYDVGLAAAM